MVSDEIIKVIDELAKKLGVTIDWSQKNIILFKEEANEKFYSSSNSNYVNSHCDIRGWMAIVYQSIVSCGSGI